MTIDRRRIAELLPHAGTMCLLDGVVFWDDVKIRCLSSRHRDAANPLRNHGRLGILSGVEFAVQAMALHGSLAGRLRSRARGGYVASLRDVVCRCDRLDLVVGDLIVEADRVMGDDERAVYRFALRSDERELVSGRATVVLAALPP